MDVYDFRADFYAIVADDIFRHLYVFNEKE